MMSGYERVMNAIRELDLAEVEVRYSCGQKLKFDLTKKYDVISQDLLEQWLSNIEWGRVVKVKWKTCSGEKTSMYMPGCGGKTHRHKSKHHHHDGCICDKCKRKHHHHDGCKCDKCKPKHHHHDGCKCDRCKRKHHHHDGCKCDKCKRKHHHHDKCKCDKCKPPHSHHHDCDPCRPDPCCCYADPCRCKPRYVWRDQDPYTRFQPKPQIPYKHYPSGNC